MNTRAATCFIVLDAFYQTIMSYSYILPLPHLVHCWVDSYNLNYALSIKSLTRGFPWERER
uniref:Uncharacterized protein n=1 Tax=Rhizophora mucronata TaxID=61149 RepID=A0A2P2P4G6_RHIMU